MEAKEARDAMINHEIVIIPGNKAGPIISIAGEFAAVDTASGISRGIPISGISLRKAPIAKK